MDILKTAREIGFFELGYNLAKIPKSSSLTWRIAEKMPLPDDNFMRILSDVPEMIGRLGKTKCIFLTPEIALIERLSAAAGGITEAIIITPADMDPESLERLRNNLPGNMKVSLWSEPYFPNSFIPRNGVIIACGYMADYRPMVLPETYRMIKHYWEFRGQRIFVPYVHIPTAVRYGDWQESTSDFTMVWMPDKN